MPDQLSVGTKKASPKRTPARRPRRAPSPVADHASSASPSGAASQTSKVGKARQSSAPPPRATTSLSRSDPRSRCTRSPYACGAFRPQRPTTGACGRPLTRTAGRSGDDDGAAGRRGDHRRVEHLGGGLGALGVPAPDDEHLEDELTRPRPDSDDLRADLDDVAGLDALPELHVAVGGEEPLVTVGADAHLRRDVTE